MNNFDKFIIETERLQCSPAENLELVIKYIAENKTITFFSWKMFDIVKPTFDPALADKYIEKEKEFIKILIKLKIKFIYIKLIPDELPRIFYGKGLNRQAITFAKQVEKYFKNIYPNTKVIRLTKILNRKTYDLVFYQSLSSGIDPKKLEKEMLFRKDKEIGLKAFGLFAAETAIIYRYFKNPVLLAGTRSIDTYKYEFFKYPQNRPTLPKLFVL
ncbi:MAG: hypothetical protein AAB768_03980 [Patescibacteria group bacterium]